MLHYTDWCVCVLVFLTVWEHEAIYSDEMWTSFLIGTKSQVPLRKTVSNQYLSHFEGACKVCSIGPHVFGFCVCAHIKGIT